jgi:tetratricopeptide (TPR) repeat protein
MERVRFALIILPILAAGCSSSEEKADVYFLEGVGHQWAQRYNKAINAFTRALRCNPRKVPAYLHRGAAYAARKEYDKALADFTEAVHLRPEDERVYRARAGCYVSAGQSEQALADFAEAVRLAPQSPQAREGLAWLLATCPDDSVRDGQRALEHATQACELTGWKECHCLAVFAAALAESGDYREAARRQQEAMGLPGWCTYEEFEKVRSAFHLYEKGLPFREQ